MTPFKIDEELTLEEDEYRTYLIVQKAVEKGIKPVEARVGDMEKCMYGKGGMKSTIITLKEKVQTHGRMIYALYGILGTIIAGVSISIVTYISIRIF